MSREKQFCFKVTCDCTNAARHSVSTGDIEDSSAEHDYLECENGVLYVMAKNIAEVERLIGANIQQIEKLGWCYSWKNA
jgi:hypothetical protein